MADEERFDLDLDAVVPQPQRYVTLKGQRYGVLSIIDIPSAEALEILRIDRDVAKAGLTDQIELVREMVQKLAPSMTDEILAGVTTAQMLRIAAHALGIAEADETPPQTVAASSNAGTAAA